MGQVTHIAWCDHTFNPWIGCTKVSAGCANCYAEALMDKRWGKVKWGPQGTRQRTSESNWREPFKWGKAAAKAGERRRVFCASLADVFEDRPELVPWRRDLFELIRRTPHLDWLLLTKRPERVMLAIREVARTYNADTSDASPPILWLRRWISDEPPANIWLGTSVEHQEAADERIPHLLRCPATVRFLSCEPLLGTIDLSRALNIEPSAACAPIGRSDGWMQAINGAGTNVDWVIVGGESGHGARPMHPQWARDIRDQCQAADVAFFFKQWGEWVDLEQSPACLAARDNGHNPGFCPIGLDGLPTETPGADRSRGDVTVYRFGKKAAGRLLDGREWSEFPAAAVKA